MLMRTVGMRPVFFGLDDGLVPFVQRMRSQNGNWKAMQLSRKVYRCC